MRLYVATKFERVSSARAIMAALESDGHEITYDWTRPIRPRDPLELANYQKEQATRELIAVMVSEVVVMVPAPGCKGAWVEVGIAIGRGKRVIVIGDPTGPGGSCVFEALATVHRVPNLLAARALLKVWERP